ncbi:Trp biosynthesis-associated membrane protein [Phycicoccus sp. Soil748]|uniref:Trp biosynthesis-associated membrane protein n=1 Tax=Intrasporangiaceae TaxID=85021 RepID=UPI000702CBC4|nr:Trp biosynthesis-associated membrane protein [Phycicoccus sp. Soil748]KRE52841.1 hypothetical protein ASG70_16020 [Phycicoccus sp. Soil748]
MRRLRLTSKAAVILLALLGAGTLLASGGRTWVTGTIDDPVMGASRVTGTGSQVASGVVALALVAAAAALASTTSGPVVRRVTVVVLALAALGEAWLAAHVALSPQEALGREAARSLGRTGTLETHATPTSWPWVALVACVPLLLAAVGGWFGARGWRGLGARYEAPGATAGARGQRVASDWDRLDAGEDPTERHDPSGT